MSIWLKIKLDMKKRRLGKEDDKLRRLEIEKAMKEKIDAYELDIAAVKLAQEQVNGISSRRKVQKEGL